ncbi:hypothetical protein P7K49_016673 [Saguinus oedipus]|uniref:Uncharacterized protein n=1 Tax=Saguinus oedipus TaxID=9490 RepID=A0ABQ9VCR2_SAGOE|nr:hypothetical protein P7K49_016673 [Saguinus oedipus]
MYPEEMPEQQEKEQEGRKDNITAARKMVMVKKLIKRAQIYPLQKKLPEESTADKEFARSINLNKITEEKNDACDLSTNNI